MWGYRLREATRSDACSSGSPESCGNSHQPQRRVVHVGRAEHGHAAVVDRNSLNHQVRPPQRVPTGKKLIPEPARSDEAMEIGNRFALDTDIGTDEIVRDRQHSDIYDGPELAEGVRDARPRLARVSDYRHVHIQHLSREHGDERATDE